MSRSSSRWKRTGATLPSSDCISREGQATSCESADALFVTSVENCDLPGVTVSLGMDPEVVEMLLDVREMGTQCAAAPTDQARAVGATASDLVAMSEGHQRAGLMACLANASDFVVVPCSEPHRAEPVTAWRPATNPSAIRDECSSAAASFVAGRVDVHGHPLSSGWLTTDHNQEPLYRCLVKSTAPLRDTVYGLSGRPLPTVGSR